MVTNPRLSGKMKQGTIWLSLLLILVILSSCGGTSSTTHKSTAQTPLAIVANTGGDYTQNFNPYSPNANAGAQGMIYETLYFYNRIDGSAKPWLAMSQEVSSDATSVTYHLRQGVQWSDGQAFSSSDVVFTLNLLKKYSGMDTNGLWQFVKSVNAPDTSTVTVTLNQAFSPLLWYLGGQTWILPEHIWSTVGDASQYADPNPVGTGPYMLKSFSPQIYDLTKNPNYWQPGKPEVKDLTFPAFSSNTSAELALNRGQIEWAGLYIPNLQQTYVSRDPAHNHYWFPASDVVMLYVNTAKPPFDQLAVRQAISNAIDRNQLYQVAESGYEPPAHPTGLVLPVSKSYLDPQYANLSFTVDTSKSAELLQSAGFTKGANGIYVDKKGNKLSFTITVVSGWTDWITASQIMASELKAVGMDVTVNTVAYDAYYNALQMGTYDVAMSWTNAGPTPYYLYDALLRSTNTAPVGQSANSNWERWSDPNTDKLLNQFASTTDITVQQQAIAGLETIMVQNLPAIPLTVEPYWYEYSTAHYTGWPDASHQYAEPSPFTFPDCEMVVLNLHPVD